MSLENKINNWNWAYQQLINGVALKCHLHPNITKIVFDNTSGKFYKHMQNGDVLDTNELQLIVMCGDAFELYEE